MPDITVQCSRSSLLDMYHHVLCLPPHTPRADNCTRADALLHVSPQSPPPTGMQAACASLCFGTAGSHAACMPVSMRCLKGPLLPRLHQQLEQLLPPPQT
mmetsp:Transcript_6212/g.15446  ORF Transcript_6212/g.15446 Transcript_6212/m.15446 type:complete len:100 (+) Transcript_6212:93-392(+)